MRGWVNAWDGRGRMVGRVGGENGWLGGICGEDESCCARSVVLGVKGIGLIMR